MLKAVWLLWVVCSPGFLSAGNCPTRPLVEFPNAEACWAAVPALEEGVKALCVEGRVRGQ